MRKDRQKKHRNRDGQTRQTEKMNQTERKGETDRYTESRKREQVSATQRERERASII